jgi:O-antigen/teichoic acid export membrane protein
VSPRVELKAGTVRRLLSSSFVHQVSETYATQILVVGLGLANSIVVTRILGPDGRGLFAVANTIAAIGVQLANLGLHSSNTYHVSRDTKTLPLLIGNSLMVSICSGALALAAFVFFRERPELAPLGGPLLALALLAIPVGLANLLLQNLLIGTQQIHTYNVIDLGTRVLAVSLVAATAPLGQVSPQVIFALVLATVVLALAWAFSRLRAMLSSPVAWSVGFLLKGLPYGLRSYWASLFAFLVLKSDIVLVKYLRGSRETGYYAVAVGLADILLMFPTVVGTVLFPRLAAAPTVAERWKMTKRILVVMAPGTPVALVAVLVTVKPLIHLAYGSAFDPSLPAVLWLLPGVGFLAINVVFMNLFAACGMPMIAVYSPLVALLVNVVLNLRLVPLLGFVGASVSSTVAYGLMLALSLLYARYRLLPDRNV